MQSGLEGKVALVTGAAQGIGRAVAERLVDAGAIVWAADVQEITDPGGFRTLRLDVTREHDWALAVARVVEESGGIDVLVNNAGTVGSYASITDISIDDWRRVTELNEFGVFLGMRTVIPVLQSRGGGAVVNVSSIWGLVGAAGVAAYQASKGAVTVMSRNAAATYASDGIRVNSVHPGLIWTPMTRAQDDTVSDGLVERTPLGRAGEAEEVADAVVFLASDRASYVTGIQLPVDGGFTSI